MIVPHCGHNFALAGSLAVQFLHRIALFLGTFDHECFSKEQLLGSRSVPARARLILATWLISQAYLPKILYLSTK
jgi:hypothetical protein